MAIFAERPAVERVGGVISFFKVSQRLQLREEEKSTVALTTNKEMAAAEEEWEMLSIRQSIIPYTAIHHHNTHPCSLVESHVCSLIYGLRSSSSSGSEFEIVSTDSPVGTPGIPATGAAGETTHQCHMRVIVMV